MKYRLPQESTIICGTDSVCDTWEILFMAVGHVRLIMDYWPTTFGGSLRRSILTKSVKRFVDTRGKSVFVLGIELYYGVGNRNCQRSSVDVFLIEFQQYRLFLWNTWKHPFMALLKAGFIMDRYNREQELTELFSVKGYWIELRIRGIERFRCIYWVSDGQTCLYKPLFWFRKECLKSGQKNCTLVTVKFFSFHRSRNSRQLSRNF
jgi:hypothetical protein